MTLQLTLLLQIFKNWSNSEGPSLIRAFVYYQIESFREICVIKYKLTYSPFKTFRIVSPLQADLPS